MDEGGALRLCVFGALEATRCGPPVPLGGRRQRAVLAVLVIARGAAVPADRLADCVWDADAPANTAGALQSYVSHLRRRLQPESEARRRGGVIASVGRGYALHLDADAVDAWVFEDAVASSESLPPDERVPVLDDALRLWRGPAYGEYAGQGWADAEITRLDELRAVARERLLEGRLALGESALLVPELEALVTEDPLREERWRLLVLALYRAQRQADALDALRRARHTLAEALGVDPGPALRVLEQEVLTQSPSLDAPAVTPAVTPSAVAVPAARPPDLATTSGLVDRDREVAALRRAVEDLRAGTGGVLVIEGPAGIGKTQLLSEGTRLATAADIRVLSSRGTQLERTFGFGAVRQLFEAGTLDPVRRDALLGGSAASARGVFEHVADDQRADGTFAVLHGLYWLTVNLTAEGPLLLAVDDVQWCDGASLRFLAYLVTRLEGLPVLLLVTMRTGEDHPDDDLLADVVLAPSARTLRPQPLSEAATAQLVHARLGEPAGAFVEACQRATAGNPLLVRQLLRALEDEDIPPDVSHTDTVRAVGSRAVSSLVTLRLRRMPPDVTAAARAVAVLGPGADLPTVAMLAELPEDRAAAALDLLSRAEVLRSRAEGPIEDGSLAFVHALVRDAVYDDLPAADRALHHERAARILQQQGAEAEQVAAHLLLAPRRGSGAAVAVLRAAARTVVGRGAPDSAVVLLRRALEEPALGRERIDVLVELGLAEAMVDGPASVAHLSEAYTFLDDARERADVAMVVCRAHVFTSPPGVATDFARSAAAALPSELDDARQGLVALQRLSGHMHGLPPERYRPDDPPAVQGEGPGARMLAAVLAYERMLDARERDRAIELASFAIEGTTLLAADNGLLWVCAAAVLALADADVGDFWIRARTYGHVTGSLFAVLSVNLWEAFAQWRHGRLDDALQSLLDAGEQQRMWGSLGIAPAYTAAFTTGVHVDRGDLEAADRVVHDASRLTLIGEGARLLCEATAALRLAQERPEDALTALAATIDPLGIANPVWAPWRGLRARALAALGRSDEAAPLLEEEVALLRRWGAPAPLGASLVQLGQLRGADGTAELREAVQLLQGGTAPVELARARLALGRAAGVADVEAVTLLHAAVAGANACGASGVGREAAAALAARGQTVDAPDEVHELTSRERQVLDLTAAGLDLHTVAQRMFLPPGTVAALLRTAADRVRA